VPEPSRGVQNERTALAWQRTALSLAGASAALTRLTFDRLGPVALVSAAVAVPLTLWVFVESSGRYQHDAQIRRRRRSRGGRAPAALAIAVVVMALTELAALLLGGG
jgi:uncharacterized membrane protein YidH (DUF202 family)